MQIKIKTTADQCHIMVNIKLHDHSLLSLIDSDSGTIELLPNITYRFEWFVKASGDAHAQIEADIDPANNGFPAVMIDKEYPAGSWDGNVFLFTL